MTPAYGDFLHTSDIGFCDRVIDKASFPLPDHVFQLCVAAVQHNPPLCQRNFPGSHYSHVEAFPN